jgi:hypothetical protein
MQSGVVHPYQISTQSVEGVWTMRKSQCMVFCKLGFITNQESKKEVVFVHAVKAYVGCKRVAQLILNLSTRCR